MSARCVVRFRCDAPECGASVDVESAGSFASAKDAALPNGWAKALTGWTSAICGCPGDHAKAIERAEKALHAHAVLRTDAINAALETFGKTHPDPRVPSWCAKISVG